MIFENLNVNAVIFDLDGTIIDSVPFYYRVMASTLEIVGLPPAPKSLVAEFMTEGLIALEKMIPEEMKDFKESLIEKCITVGREISRDVFRHEVRLIHGVRPLFLLLANNKIRIGIVTSTEKRNIGKKLGPLARNDLMNYLGAVIAIEDSPRRKPAPDPLIECARRLSVEPETCIYVGDSHVDMQAGKAAGMMTVGVLTGLDDYEKLKAEHPTMILNSVDELKRSFI